MEMVGFNQCYYFIVRNMPSETPEPHPSKWLTQPRVFEIPSGQSNQPVLNIILLSNLTQANNPIIPLIHTSFL